MTRVFFYHNAPDRIAATAVLIGKAVSQKKSLLIYAPDAEVAAAIDRYLWMYPPTGFIPHAAIDSPLAAETPVLIALTDDLDDAGEAGKPRRHFGGEVEQSLILRHRIELTRDQERGAGRQRAKFYKDRGYDIQYFDLSRSV